MSQTPLPEVSDQNASRAGRLEKTLSRLRHDVRSALAPALLAADLLAAQPDERTKRHANAVLRAIEKALAHLDASRVEIAPPGGSGHQDSP